MCSFDSIDHGLLRDFVKQRITDGGILRLIGKWLNAGVVEAGVLTHPDKGTPQGGVVSPVLANLFLHHVLDEWFIKEVQPRLKGSCFLNRFADDFIIGFSREEDACRVMEVLPKRFNRFKLTIHPEKTVLVQFIRPQYGHKPSCENGTFNFLGFTHYWAQSRLGRWHIKRQTIGKKLRGFMKRVWEWCRHNRHDPLREQHQMLCSKLRGHYQYYGIRGNYKMLEVAFEYVEYAWKYWLSRRSHKGYINWAKFETSIKRVFPLPKPRIIHAI
ncbi:reverse transcriptase domain-containing protein [candidate division CSSED10-310 bacterium]|uniref:Reverse transcriptase domain-containing protein n=1 Tax=candidate division CSSED10-310 bacterium TaxID=2855610 RepID=A0ABV6Z2F0_UNCC1